MTTTTDVRNALNELADASEAAIASHHPAGPAPIDTIYDLVRPAPSRTRRRFLAGIAAAAVVLGGAAVWMVVGRSDSDQHHAPAAGSPLWPIHTLPFAITDGSIVLEGVDIGHGGATGAPGPHYTLFGELRAGGHTIELQVIDSGVGTGGTKAGPMPTTQSAPATIQGAAGSFECIAQPGTQCEGALSWPVRGGSLIAQLSVPARTLSTHEQRSLLERVAAGLDFTATTPVLVPFRLDAHAETGALVDVSIEDDLAFDRMEPTNRKHDTDVDPAGAVVANWDSVVVGLDRRPLPADGYLNGHRTTVNGRPAFWVGTGQRRLYLSEPNGTRLMVADNDNLESLAEYAAFARGISVSDGNPNRIGWYDASRALPGD